MIKKIIFFLFIINILYVLISWLSGSSDFLNSAIPEKLIAFGRLSGLIAVFLVLLQIILIGRIYWIERIFGLDKLSRIHHLNGILSLVFIIIHPFFLTLGYSLSSKQQVFHQVILFLTQYDDLPKAYISVFLFFLTVLLSFYLIKKRLRYEFWYYVHLFTYLAILLAFGHQLKLGGDFIGNKAFLIYWYILYIAVFTFLFIFRIIIPLYTFYKHRFKVEKIIKETDFACSIYLNGKNLDLFKFKCGQFGIFRFLNKKLIWQSHPFSFSDSPNGKHLRITVKNSGDFTKDISLIPLNTPVIIEGPYGIFTASEQKNSKILFIAGGIGITPIFAIIKNICKDKKDAILLYSSKTEKEVVFKKEINGLTEKEKNIKCHYLITGEIGKQKEKGRIDEEKIKRLVPDYLSRKIYICGPPKLINHSIKLFLSLNVPKKNIYFEKFFL
jgi:predicted ferric reductase